jgi:hypothetical protein
MTAAPSHQGQKAKGCRVGDRVVAGLVIGFTFSFSLYSQHLRPKVAGLQGLSDFIYRRVRAHTPAHTPALARTHAHAHTKGS